MYIMALFIILAMALASMAFVFIGRRKNKSKKVFGLIGIVILSCVVAACLCILFFLWAFGEFRDSTPAVKDDFYLHKTGTTREYIITPGFRNWLAGAQGDYEISVYLKNIPFSEEEIKFHPRVKVDTLLNNTVLESVVVDEVLRVITDEGYTKKVLLAKLPKILWGIRNNSYTVKVEVLQGDETLLPYVESFYTQIAVDEYP